MSVFRRKGSKYFSFKFMVRGKTIWESTRQESKQAAKDMEAAKRKQLAQGRYDLLPAVDAPTFKQFIETQVKPKVDAPEIIEIRTGRRRPLRYKWLGSGLKPLLGFEPLAKAKLDGINDALVGDYITHRLTGEKVNGRTTRKPVTITTVNRELRILRRCASLAMRWGKLDKAKLPVIELAGPDNMRDRIITDSELQAYLLVCPQELSDFVTLLADSGLRTAEGHALTWDSISFSNGRHGTVFVRRGKSKCARRTVPLTSRLRAVLEQRWERMGKPQDGWVFPSKHTKSGHVSTQSFRKAHLKALKISGVRPFVLHSLRHTYATKVGQTGINPWVLSSVMGWSDISMSMKYIHSSEDMVLAAFDKAEATLTA